MSEQRHYFPPYPLDYEIALIAIQTKLRINNDLNKTFISLHKGDENYYPQLDGLESHSLDMVKEEFSEPEWQYEI